MLNRIAFFEIRIVDFNESIVTKKIKWFQWYSDYVWYWIWIHEGRLTEKKAP